MLAFDYASFPFRSIHPSCDRERSALVVPSFFSTEKKTTFFLRIQNRFVDFFSFVVSVSFEILVAVHVKTYAKQHNTRRERAVVVRNSRLDVLWEFAEFAFRVFWGEAKEKEVAAAAAVRQRAFTKWLLEP